MEDKQLAALSAQADASLGAAGLSPLLTELVRIRVSRINGCMFCLRLHTRDAIAKGEATDRLAVVAAWWKSQYFTPAEQAVLPLEWEQRVMWRDERLMDVIAAERGQMRP